MQTPDTVTPTVHLVELPEPRTGDDGLRGRINALLCPEEQARLATLRSSTAAWEYGCSHAALRILLGRHLNLPPAEVTFHEPGKPFVAPRLRCPPPHDWQVSLSHSAPYAAIAVARQGPIGIDIEHPGHAQVALEGLRLYMTDSEIQQLERLPVGQRAVSALQTWCLKEAVLKATGQGLALDPRELSLHFAEAGGPATARVQGCDSSFGVRLLQAGVAAGAVVALAQGLPAGRPLIECHRFEALLS